MPTDFQGPQLRTNIEPEPKRFTEEYRVLQDVTKVLHTSRNLREMIQDGRRANTRGPPASEISYSI